MNTAGHICRMHRVGDICRMHGAGHICRMHGAGHICRMYRVGHICRMLIAGHICRMHRAGHTCRMHGAGHICRIHTEGTPGKIFEKKTYDSRPAGKPKDRSTDKGQRDVRKQLGTAGRKREALDGTTAETRPEIGLLGRCSNSGGGGSTVRMTSFSASVLDGSARLSSRPNRFNPSTH